MSLRRNLISIVELDEKISRYRNLQLQSYLHTYVQITHAITFDHFPKAEPAVNNHITLI